MKNAISLLGSTGSIGRQTLETAELLGLRVRSLGANKNIKLLEAQMRRFKPDIVAVFDNDSARDFKTRVRDTDVRVVAGIDGLVEAACADGVSTVVTAVVGTIGLIPTLAAIEQGRTIALANKETLVCAGSLVMKTAKERGTAIIPVDSEHSALFQCLKAEKPEHVKRLILTASGGPFRGWGRDRLTKVTPEMALRHPNWSMGRKITIDSATMMNKGLELIEAMHLFDVPPEKIGIVVHPESVVHSMVEFNDNSVIAQLAQPDMCLPIQYALTYPERRASLVDSLDLTKLISGLTFEEPDFDAFPCLRLAIETAQTGGIAPAVMNGANEAAVELFLAGKIGFYGIYESVSAALDKITNIENPSLEDLMSADIEAKRFVIESRGAP
ncbi:MAG: 1-deoxy-D-xylulose-5-phosphate reductoisomerase [Oscillospiraceae bacterium]|nr:1-deoxy-D-xylulose-5-phosphate reductoisomerase [Oscillospiraceae bacterium]